MTSAARQDASHQRTSRTACMPAGYLLREWRLPLGWRRLANYWPAIILPLALWGVYVHKPVLVEVCIYLGLWAAFYRGVRRLFSGISRPQRRLIVTCVGLMIAGQLVSKSTRSFPFVQWSMYTRSTGSTPAAYYEYSAQLKSGRECTLDLSRQYVQWPLFVLARNVINSPASQRQQRVASYEQALLVQAQLYDSAHPDDPLEAISVTRCTIPFDEYQGRSSIERAPFWHVNVR